MTGRTASIISKSYNAKISPSSETIPLQAEESYRKVLFLRSKYHIQSVDFFHKVMFEQRMMNH